MGSLGKTSLASLSKLLAPNKAPPLKLDGPAKQEVVGWVRPLTATDEDLNTDASYWDMGDAQIDNYFLLRLRYERRNVPSSLTQMLFKAQLKEHQEKTGKSMARRERQELKNKLLADLTKRTLPSIQYTDGLWRSDDGELQIFTTSKSHRIRFEQLFYKTFGQPLKLSLVKTNGPQFVAEDSLDSLQKLSEHLSHMTKIEPSTFAAAARPN
jgi:DNA recombination-dependent growth factor C